ncbi:hypothetical protein HHK36_020410 [Tetracentron sinense]|uniref:S-protein homolog n=1 Tax=Tetracentron sinense TaxID=13715 RepID=A0A835D7Z9_TETSI|nr:hypothetical protein HHK36_020410 [Tetracentron sinense]
MIWVLIFSKMAPTSNGVSMSTYGELRFSGATSIGAVGKAITKCSWPVETLKDVMTTARILQDRMDYISRTDLICLALALSQCVLGKYHVHVENQLGEGKTLELHCQSKDDDLSLHFLTFHQEFTWSFNTNIFGTTLFYCDFKFGNVKGHYDVFVAKRDDHDDRCRDGCFWGVRPDGLYFLQNEFMKYELVYRWPNA